MTPLAEILARRIGAGGPMRLSDYMAECLLHPEHGYYTTRAPFGTAGDFTTAPEISQMFGELVGLSIAQAWLEQGAPAPAHLVELGPGRGTLSADLLRATRAVPGFHDALALHLVEMSPSLRAVQARSLAGHDPRWHDTFDTVPDGPCFVLANEFFDALPIRQFRRVGGGWAECHVALGEGGLRAGWSAPAPIGLLQHRLEDTQEGDIVELCPAAPDVIGAIAQRIARHGGAALVVDYGDWRSRGDTFQAVRAHVPVDPFAEPGQADLTAHVDFEALAQAAADVPGVAVSRMTPQGVFLERLGITPRAQTLARQLSGAALDAHVAAHRRLTHPDEMGSLFKCLALTSAGAPPFPGLTP